MLGARNTPIRNGLVCWSTPNTKKNTQFFGRYYYPHLSVCDYNFRTNDFCPVAEITASAYLTTRATSCTSVLWVLYRPNFFVRSSLLWHVYWLQTIWYDSGSQIDLGDKPCPSNFMSATHGRMLDLKRVLLQISEKFGLGEVNPISNIRNKMWRRSSRFGNLPSCIVNL